MQRLRTVPYDQNQTTPTVLPPKSDHTVRNLLETQAFIHHTVLVQGRVSPPGRGNSFLAIDVETAAELESGGKVSRDALDPHKAELRILSAATPSGNIIVHDFRAGPLPDYLRAAIATSPPIAHGAAFDMAVPEANGIKTSRNVFCTLTASRLLTAGLRDGNDLGALVKRHLDIALPRNSGPPIGVVWSLPRTNSPIASTTSPTSTA